jgi:hypothetical protein
MLLVRFQRPPNLPGFLSVFLFGHCSPVIKIGFPLPTTAQLFFECMFLLAGQEVWVDEAE